MSHKRGRPPSHTDDDTVNRRRQLTAARTRAYRQRRRDAQPPVTQPTAEQLQQGEMIVDLAFNDWDAAETLTQLGLRTQGLSLAQDPNDARRQRDAVPVDEHEMLYDERDCIITGTAQNAPVDVPGRDHNSSTPSSNRGPHPRGGQSDLSRFFQTLPARNPLASTPPRRQTAHTPSLPRSRAGHPASHTQTSIYCPSAQGGSEDWRYKDNDGDDDTVDDEDGQGAGGGHDFEDNFEGNFEDEDREVSNIDGVQDTQYDADSSPAGVVDNHEEDSVYDFASENSAHSDDEGGDPGEVPAHNYTLQKLYDQLQGGHHGCPPEQHEEQLRLHMDAVGIDHHGLGDIFNYPDFPSVLALSDFISADRLARQPVPTPAQWHAMFCGLHPQQSRPHPRPMHVCLHKEETQEVEAQVAFDIDSFLGFASSLAMARQGLWYQPAPQMRQNMTTDVHLETPVFRNGSDPEQAPRSSLALLRDVPHFLLGRVVGAHDITVHILFPYLVPAQAKFTSLTKEQLDRWLDRVFHPAVYRYCDAHYTQHLPASHRHALANSKAHQVEGRKIETASYQAQQAIGYHLQPEYLGDIWSAVLETVTTTPGLMDFRDPQLFFSAKGTKLQFKTSTSRPTMLDAMEDFHNYLERVIDLGFVFLERFYVDLGKEICPRVSLLETRRCHVGDEAQVYLWRRCCLRHYITDIYDGEPPAEGHDGQRYFDQNMLHDAASLTSVTPKQSKLRKGGLIYTQMYGSVKEISDATKCNPFDNDGLEELALDPQIRQGARNAAGGHRRDARIVERAYCASKRRARDALTDSRKKSFGIREEHRISWSLFQALLRRLRLESHEDLEIVLSDCPSYVWAIKTEVYLNFLWRSADKFATGFEVVRARCRAELVTWEQTKMMAMFLRCLRFVFGGHLLRRESALWWSKRERTVGQPPRQRVWYGLGFSNTLSRYKYCWLEPRIDWNQLAFKSEVTDQVLFGNNMLRDQYLRRGGQVRDFFGATRRLELALQWIGLYHEEATIRDRLIHWMVHLCLQQFRVDVLGSVKLEILEEQREEALEANRSFCYEYLESILAQGVYLLSGNRCDFKQATHLGHSLFDFDDGRIRTHWEDRPFRKLYRRTRTALGVRFGPTGTVQTFSRRFWRCLYAFHWILPYPCAEVLMQTTKMGQRMWYSIQPQVAVNRPVEQLKPEEWEWARKSWRAGQAPALPLYLSWTKEEWEEWIERHRHE